MTQDEQNKLNSYMKQYDEAIADGDQPLATLIEELIGEELHWTLAGARMFYQKETETPPT